MNPLNLLFREDICTDDGELYLQRWTLLKLPWIGKLMLHRIARPDEARDLHDHPWPFVTLILRGGYVEKTSVGACERRPGDLAAHGPRYSHAIIDVPNGPAWTLVLRGPRMRGWGFWVHPGGHATWVPWDQYVGGSAGCEGGAR